MLARAHTFAIAGLVTQHVVVEVDVCGGLPALSIAGMPRALARQTGERVRSAIRNSGCALPARRITANLVPALAPATVCDVDLALACALLAAGGQLECAPLDRVALLGELGLDGSVRPSRWTAAIALGAREAGFSRVPILCPGTLEPAVLQALRLTALGSLRACTHTLRRPPSPGRLHAA